MAEEREEEELLWNSIAYDVRKLTKTCMVDTRRLVMGAMLGKGRSEGGGGREREGRKEGSTNGEGRRKLKSIRRRRGRSSRRNEVRDDGEQKKVL